MLKDKLLKSNCFYFKLLLLLVLRITEEQHLKQLHFNSGVMTYKPCDDLSDYNEVHPGSPGNDQHWSLLTYGLLNLWKA